MPRWRRHAWLATPRLGGDAPPGWQRHGLTGLQRRNRFWRLICINDRRGDHGPDHPKRAGGQRLSLRGDYKESDETTETPVTKPSLRGASARGAFATGGLRAAAVAVVLSIAGMTGSALAADPAAAPPPAALSAADQTCLGCHGMAGVEKPLSSGETLSLHIAGDSFAQSVHAALGCTGCHTDINLASHPPASNSIASKRAFSIAMVQVCRTCHADKFEQVGEKRACRAGQRRQPGCPDLHRLPFAACHDQGCGCVDGDGALQVLPRRDLRRVCQERAWRAAQRRPRRGAAVLQLPRCA